MEIQFRSKKEEKEWKKTTKRIKKEDRNRYLLRESQLKPISDSYKEYHNMIEKVLTEVCGNDLEFAKINLILVEGFLPKSLESKVVKHFVLEIKDSTDLIDEKWLLLKSDYNDYLKNNEEDPFKKMKRAKSE